MQNTAHARGRYPHSIEGIFRSADDVRDGYIHLSTEEQMAGTLAKHFSGQSALLIALCQEETLDPALKWEPSRGGALFPHLYRNLQLTDVTALVPVPDDRNGWTLPTL